MQSALEKTTFVPSEGTIGPLRDGAICSKLLELQEIGNGPSSKRVFQVCTSLHLGILEGTPFTVQAYRLQYFTIIPLLALQMHNEVTRVLCGSAQVRAH